MPNIHAKNNDETGLQNAGLLNSRFVRVDELDRLLDAIAVVSTHLEIEEEEPR